MNCECLAEYDAVVSAQESQDGRRHVCPTVIIIIPLPTVLNRLIKRIEKVRRKGGFK